MSLPGTWNASADASAHQTVWDMQALADAKQPQELHQSLGAVACHLCQPELEKQSSEHLLCLQSS